jgi:hypothetical protein
MQYLAGHKTFIFSTKSKSVLGINQSLTQLGTWDSFHRNKTAGDIAIVRINVFERGSGGCVGGEGILDETELHCLLKFWKTSPFYAA